MLSLRTRNVLVMSSWACTCVHARIQLYTRVCTSSSTERQAAQRRMSVALLKHRLIGMCNQFPYICFVCKQKISAHRHVTMECSTSGCRLVVEDLYTSKTYREV